MTCRKRSIAAAAAKAKRSTPPATASGNPNMKKTALLAAASVSLMVVAVAPSARADEKKIVAVLPFASPNDHSLGKMGDNAQPTFITELVKSKKVKVVDEKRLDDAVKRFARDMTGIMDQSKVKQIGKFLKADYVVAGSLSFTGDTFTMTVHVTNVETLELEMADDRSEEHTS